MDTHGKAIVSDRHDPYRDGLRWRHLVRLVSFFLAGEEGLTPESLTPVTCKNFIEKGNGDSVQRSVYWRILCSVLPKPFQHSGPQCLQCLFFMMC